MSKQLRGFGSCVARYHINLIAFPKVSDVTCGVTFIPPNMNASRLGVLVCCPEILHCFDSKCVSFGITVVGSFGRRSML